MRISEIFYSLQGEGLLAGTPSVFIRVAGCPLRCRWCDTAYAWDMEHGVQYSVDQIIQQSLLWHTRYVVVTGGEPFVLPDGTARVDLPALTAALRNQGKHVTIETAGISHALTPECDLMSVSPKLPNAGLGADHKQVNLDGLAYLAGHYTHQVKFVVEGPDDLPYVEDVLRACPSIRRERVLLMPQARTRQELLEKSGWVTQACLDHGLVFGPRLQVWLWAGQRGR